MNLHFHPQQHQNHQNWVDSFRTIQYFVSMYKIISTGTRAVFQFDLIKKASELAA